MKAVTEWIRTNKKLVAGLIVALLALAGVAVKPDVVEGGLDAVVGVEQPATTPSN